MQVRKTPAQALKEAADTIHEYENHFSDIHKLFLAIHTEKAVSVYEKCFDSLNNYATDTACLSQIFFIQTKLHHHYTLLDAHYRELGDALSLQGKNNDALFHYKKSLNYALKTIGTVEDNKRYNLIYNIALRHRNLADIVNANSDKHQEAVELAQNGLTLVYQLEEMDAYMIGATSEIRTICDERVAELQRGLNAVIESRQISDEYAESKYDSDAEEMEIEAEDVVEEVDTEADTEVEDNVAEVTPSASPISSIATSPHQLFRPIVASPEPAADPANEPIARRTRNGMRKTQ